MTVGCSRAIVPCFVLALVSAGACSSSVLTGNGTEDLETLTSLVDVDCNAEAVCGPVPHCMTDAWHAGQIGTVRVPLFANGRAYVQHLFTYDEAVVRFDDVRPALEDIEELHCLGIAAVATGTDCWVWTARGCDDN